MERELLPVLKESKVMKKELKVEWHVKEEKYSPENNMKMEIDGMSTQSQGSQGAYESAGGADNNVKSEGVCFIDGKERQSSSQSSHSQDSKRAVMSPWNHPSSLFAGLKWRAEAAALDSSESSFFGSASCSTQLSYSPHVDSLDGECSWKSQSSDSEALKFSLENHLEALASPVIGDGCGNLQIHEKVVMDDTDKKEEKSKEGGNCKEKETSKEKGKSKEEEKSRDACQQDHNYVLFC